VRTYRQLKSSWSRSLMLPVVGMFVGLLEWCFFEAHLMLSPSMTAIGVMVALVASAIALDAEGAAPEPTLEPVETGSNLAPFVNEPVARWYHR
jgi:hypothetical protein